MQTLKGDIFKLDVDAICIPTNGCLRRDGRAVCGAGLARDAQERWGEFEEILGLLIGSLGNRVHQLTTQEEGRIYLGSDEVPYHVLSYPTKPGDSHPGAGNSMVLSHYKSQVEQKWRLKGRYQGGEFLVPGWMLKSTMELVQQGAERLLAHTRIREWERVALPRVGCGRGELEWADVQQRLQPLLDDRFIAVRY